MEDRKFTLSESGLEETSSAKEQACVRPEFLHRPFLIFVKQKP